MSSKTFSFNFSQSAKMPKNFLLNSKDCACVVKYYGTSTSYDYIPDAIDTAINAIKSLINSGADDELIDIDEYSGQNSLLVPIRQTRNEVDWGLTEVTIKVINRIDVTVFDFSEIDEEEVIITPEVIDEVLIVPAQENYVKPINNTTWQPIGGLEEYDGEVIE